MLLRNLIEHSAERVPSASVNNAIFLFLAVYLLQECFKENTGFRRCSLIASRNTKLGYLLRYRQATVQNNTALRYRAPVMSDFALSGRPGNKMIPAGSKKESKSLLESNRWFLCYASFVKNYQND